MNKRQKEVIAASLEDERAVLKALESNYIDALAEIKRNIRDLQANPLTQSKIYQLEYQKMLEKQITGILDNLQGKNYKSISEYLNDCYINGYVGTMYDIHGQGIPIISPINQDAVVKAVQLTGDDIKLVNKLGVHTATLKKHVISELSRGLATQSTYAEIARNISNRGQADMKRSMTIARTEGHRIKSRSTYEAALAAKEKGADIAKQWDSALDKRTRKNHTILDGQIKELEESFEVDGKEALYPGGFGKPEEDCNCRCVALTRARWALDEDELETLKERAKYFGLDKTKNFEDFKEKYLKATETLENSGNSGIINLRKSQLKPFTKVKVEDIPPMDEQKFNTIKRNLEKRGISVIQDTDGDDYLKAMGAEAMTLSDGSAIIFQSGRVPSASAVYEEIIHTHQIKTRGMIESQGDKQGTLEYLHREIEANEKLLRYSKAYKLTSEDIESIKENLDMYYMKLKEVGTNV